MRRYNKLIALFLITTWVFASMSLGGCIEGSGKAKTESRDLSTFTGIHVSGSIDVYLAPGKTQTVKVVADDNVLDLIKTEVKGNELFIGNRKCYRSHAETKVMITLPQLTRVSISGSSDVEGSGIFVGKDLKLHVSGSGSITLAVKADDVSVHISGSGDISLKGDARDLDVHISGSGDLDARDLTADDVALSVSGSGNCKVNAKGDLVASISGSGDVRYYGTPKSVEASVSGSGSVKKRMDF